jgi:hypothetical protein
MFNSQELANAQLVPSSITHLPTITVDIQKIKDEINIFLLTKNKDLIRVYDMANMRRTMSSSGNDSLKHVLHIIREFLTSKYKEDNVKNLTIRKNFDIMTTALECLMANNIDVSSDEINTLMLGFLTKNFIW